MIIAGTGHRPDKLGGYSNEAPWIDSAKYWLGLIQPSEVISGLALGWDTYLAIAAIEMGVPLIGAVPFKGQESRWPRQSQDRYRWIVSQCREVEIVCPGEYSAFKMQVRNKWMVDHCDMVLACWDGSSGGTANCMKYAASRHVYAINVYPGMTP